MNLKFFFLNRTLNPPPYGSARQIRKEKKATNENLKLFIIILIFLTSQDYIVVPKKSLLSSITQQKWKTTISIESYADNFHLSNKLYESDF